MGNLLRCAGCPPGWLGSRKPLLIYCLGMSLSVSPLPKRLSPSPGGTNHRTNPMWCSQIHIHIEPSITSLLPLLILNAGYYGGTNTAFSPPSVLRSQPSAQLGNAGTRKLKGEIHARSGNRIGLLIISGFRSHPSALLASAFSLQPSPHPPFSHVPKVSEHVPSWYRRKRYKA